MTRWRLHARAAALLSGALLLGPRVCGQIQRRSWCTPMTFPHCLARATCKSGAHVHRDNACPVPVQLAKRLFDVDIEAADGQVAVWDDAVRFFCVKQGGKPKAYFYLDPYSRPAEKRGGAWMDEVASQSKLVCIAVMFTQTARSQWRYEPTWLSLFILAPPEGRSCSCRGREHRQTLCYR